MEDMLFQYILGGVHRFTQLRALDIGGFRFIIEHRESTTSHYFSI